MKTRIQPNADSETVLSALIGVHPRPESLVAGLHRSPDFGFSQEFAATARVETGAEMKTRIQPLMNADERGFGTVLSALIGVHPRLKSLLAGLHRSPDFGFSKEFAATARVETGAEIKTRIQPLMNADERGFGNCFICVDRRSSAARIFGGRT